MRLGKLIEKIIEKSTPNLVEVQEVIHVETSRGQRTKGKPVRVFHQYWSLDGVLLAENDVF